LNPNLEHSHRRMGIGRCTPGREFLKFKLIQVRRAEEAVKDAEETAKRTVERERRTMDKEATLKVRFTEMSLSGPLDFVLLSFMGWGG
jgi:hypothetical protein